MLSGASMPSDDKIRVAQLGPRPLLGGAILARPRVRSATEGGSTEISCPKLQSRIRASKPRFRAGPIITFLWQPTYARKSTTFRARAPHETRQDAPWRRHPLENFGLLDYSRGHFPTETHCPRHNPTRPSCAHSQRSTSMACSSPANAFERPASGCTGRESPGEHFCLQGRLVRAPCSTCDRKASASRQTACTRCAHGVHMVCTL